MAVYTVTEVSGTVNDWIAQGKYPMKEYRVHLQGTDPAAAPVLNVEWSRKAESPAPVQGQQIDVERLEDRGPRGLKLHLAQQTPTGGYRSNGSGSKEAYKADPAKQAAIAMESAQKTAVEALRLAAEFGEYKPPAAGDVAGQVKTIAAVLYAQIVEAVEGSK